MSMYKLIMLSHAYQQSSVTADARSLSSPSTGASRDRLFHPLFGQGRLSKAAFTLIELLVVIAIVAVLASLVSAAVSRAKASALSTKCRSNLRQIGLALQLYTDEQSAYPVLDNDGWTGHLIPYLSGSRPVTVCPLNKTLPESGEPRPGGLDFKFTGASYGYNAAGTDVSGQ